MGLFPIDKTFYFLPDWSNGMTAVSKTVSGSSILSSGAILYKGTFMYKLFLDDIRMPVDNGWTIVRNYNEFVDAINKYGLPKFISFDHDLSTEHYSNMPSVEKTGYDCAKFLVDYCMDNNKKIPEFYVHSMNPVGRENIKALLNNAIKHLGQ